MRISLGLVVAIVALSGGCSSSARTVLHGNDKVLAGDGGASSHLEDPGTGTGTGDGADASVEGTLPPGCQKELCNNGFDDDCDGKIDNGCPCAPGATQFCFTGSAETRGHGTC